MEKSPFLYAFQVIYSLLRRQYLENWNSIFISSPYLAGVKPNLKTLVHVVYPGKYG